MLYRVLPLNSYLRLKYKHYFKKPIDFKNPKLFSEKLWCLKRHYILSRNTLIASLYDKYTVRDYVEKKVGPKYLNEVYAVYNDPSKIRVQDLPGSFVLKITQSCGGNLICPNKEKINNAQVKQLATRWFNNYSKEVSLSNEESFHYKGKPMIICEKLLQDNNGDYPADYKIYCINGKPQFTRVCVDPLNEVGARKKTFVMNTYDKDWELMRLYTSDSHYRDEKVKVPKPQNYEEMLQVAEALSQDFPFVRVDLYNIDGAIYFGELTWFPGGCTEPLQPLEYEKYYGNMLKLPWEK